MTPRILYSLIFLAIATATQGQYIEVTVLDAHTGEAVTGAKVGLPSWDDEKVKDPNIRTGYSLLIIKAKPGAPDGVFLSHRLDPGEYEVLAEGRHYITNLEKGVRVEEYKTTRIKILLVPRLTVKGRVLDTRGKPAGVLRLSWRSKKSKRFASTYTKPDGTFILKGVDAGVGVIRFWSDYHRTRRTVRIAESFAFSL